MEKQTNNKIVLPLQDGQHRNELQWVSSFLFVRFGIVHQDNLFVILGWGTLFHISAAFHSP